MACRIGRIGLVPIIAAPVQVDMPQDCSAAVLEPAGIVVAERIVVSIELLKERSCSMIAACMCRGSALIPGVSTTRPPTNDRLNASLSSAMVIGRKW